MSVRNYRDLVVWQKSVDFVEKIYRLSGNFPQNEQYGLTNQLRRSAVSIPSNIAEGQARQHSNEFCQFLHIALGSLAEAHTQIIIANRLNYLTNEQLKDLNKNINELQKMLHSLIKKLPTTH